MGGGGWEGVGMVGECWEGWLEGSWGRRLGAGKRVLGKARLVLGGRVVEGE